MFNGKKTHESSSDIAAVIAALGQREMVAGKMYWTDSAAQTIERANLDGSDRETLLTELRRPVAIALDLSVAHDVWISSDQNDPPFEPVYDCLHFNENMMFTAACGDQVGPLTQFPLLGVAGLQLWIGQVPCQSQNLLFIGTSFEGESLPFGGNAISASIVGLGQGITLGLEGFETTDCSDVPTSRDNPYAVELEIPTGSESSPPVSWSQGNLPTLQLGPSGTTQTVANKTYEVWSSQSLDLPPFEPVRDCVRFTDSTISTDGCGDSGPLGEFPLFGVPGLSLWIGHVPCSGQDVVYFGTSFDGTVLPFDASVMSATAVGVTDEFTLALEGFENPSCSIAP